jgi:hypothetical protein
VLYLSGAVRPEWATIEGLGFMMQPNMGNALPAGALWAADNGGFTKTVPFDLDRYLRWLWGRRSAAERCLFATAPDTVGDADQTWQRSRHLLPCLRALGYKAALVAQDGWRSDEVDWTAFDALFIGGTDRFKLGEPAYALIAEARHRGKWVHCGRVNSLRRFRVMADAGCDSADGTFLAFGPATNLPQVQGWLSSVAVQPSLWSAH